MAHSRCPLGMLSGPGLTSSAVIRALNGTNDGASNHLSVDPKDNTNKKTFITFEDKSGASVNLTIFELAYNPKTPYGDQILKLCDAMLILSDCNSASSLLHVACVILSLRQLKHKKFPLMILSLVRDESSNPECRDELTQLAFVHDIPIFFVKAEDFTKPHVSEAMSSLLKLYRSFQNSGEDPKKVSRAPAILGLNRVKQGYMSKQGGKRKNWKRRYFILQSMKLQYYKDDKSFDIPKGCITLTGATLVINKGKKNHFDICTEHRTYHVKAESDADWLEWVTVISRELRGGNMVFGSPLEYLTTKRSRTVSLTLEKMVKYLCTKAKTHDLFRSDVNPSAVNELMGQFDANETKVNLATYPDAQIVAALLKIFYQEIPGKLMTKQVASSLIQVHDDSVDKLESIHDRWGHYKKIVAELPKAHLVSLKVLLDFFAEMLKSASYNGLSAYILGCLFFPTLFLVQSEETYEKLYASLHLYLDFMGAMMFHPKFLEMDDVKIDFPAPESTTSDKEIRFVAEKTRNSVYLGQLANHWSEQATSPTKSSKDLLRTQSEKTMRSAMDPFGSEGSASSTPTGIPTSKSLFAQTMVRSATEKKIARQPTKNPKNHPPSRLDMGWKIAINRDRKIFYYNKATKSSYWSYPPEEVARLPLTLPEGWKIIVDEQGNVTYEHIMEQKTSATFPEEENTALLVEPMTRTPSSRFEVDGFADIGRRQQMQDSFFVMGGFRGKAKEDLFGIFDGHGSIFTASYCSKKFAEAFSDCLEDAERSGDEPTDDLIIDAFHRAFERIDLAVKSWSQLFGTTALVAYLRGGKLFIANSGDSKAVIVQKESHSEINTIHRVSNEDEARRVRELGGKFVYDRVQGVILVTRAIGDSFLRPIVTSDPEVYVHDVSNDDVALLLCSDGVWDFVETDELAKVVRENGRVHQPAKGICDLAFAKDSSDNMTAVTVYFHPSSM